MDQRPLGPHREARGDRKGAREEFDRQSEDVEHLAGTMKDGWVVLSLGGEELWQKQVGKGESRTFLLRDHHVMTAYSLLPTLEIMHPLR